MKKISFFVFSVICVVLLCCFHASANEYGTPVESGDCGRNGDNVIWTMYDSGTLVISGQGEMQDYENNIGNSYAPWGEYFGESKVRSIVVEPGVTRIGRSAFSYLSYEAGHRMKSVTIADTVKYIASEAFWNISVYDYSFIPESVSYVGYFVFESDYSDNYADGVVYAGTVAVGYGGKIAENTEIVIKDGTTAIASDAFGDPYSEYRDDDRKPENFTSIYIPASVKGISSFRNCNNLSVTIDPENPYLCMDEYGVIYSADMTRLMYAPAKNWYGEYTIPDTVTSIGDGAFYGCKNLYIVNIGSGVKEIGDYAFAGCESLSFITIPESVRTIGISAFNGCDNLAIVDILYGTTSIGENAFDGCVNLTSVNLPNSLKSLGNNSFSNCHLLKFIDIPSSVEETTQYMNGPGLPYDFFYGCTSLETVILPDVEIGNKFRWFLHEHWGDECCDLYKNLKLIYLNNFKSDDSIEHFEIWEKEYLEDDVQILPLYAGSILGNYLSTDIKATIDGKPIKSYNIDGYTVIIAEALRDYGFDVVYDDASRTIKINEGNKTVTSTYEHEEYHGNVGEAAGDVYYTDIDAYIGNKPVKSYNIGGLTAIYISDLYKLGLVEWDENARVISFTRY